MRAAAAINQLVLPEPLDRPLLVGISIALHVRFHCISRKNKQTKHFLKMFSDISGCWYEAGICSCSHVVHLYVKSTESTWWWNMALFCSLSSGCRTRSWSRFCRTWMPRRCSVSVMSTNCSTTWRTRSKGCLCFCNSSHCQGRNCVRQLWLSFTVVSCGTRFTHQSSVVTRGSQSQRIKRSSKLNRRQQLVGRWATGRGCTSGAWLDRKWTSGGESWETSARTPGCPSRPSGSSGMEDSTPSVHLARCAKTSHMMVFTLSNLNVLQLECDHLVASVALVNICEKKAATS